MDYKEFFEFKEPPFANAPDLRFYYDGYQYGSTEKKLIHVVDQMGGLAVVVGGMGMGKSILARHVLDLLAERGSEYEVGLIIMVHAQITASWLLMKISSLLGVPESGNDKTVIIHHLFERLMQINEEGKKAVVLVDEANMLQTKEIMEEFRGLLNLEVPGKKLITFIFFGMPGLDNCLKLDEPLRQRIALRINLKPLSLEATSEYIKYRLSKADSGKVIFLEEAVKWIHACSKGVPRLINIICDNALFEGFLQRKKEIGPDIIKLVSGELMVEKYDFDAETVLQAESQNPGQKVNQDEKKPVSGEVKKDEQGPAGPKVFIA